MKKIEIFRNAVWEVTAIPYQLQFRFPFKLALNTRSFTDIVILRIKSKKVVGYGEAALPPYLGATVESVIQFLKNTDWETILNLSISDALQIVESSAGDNNAAKAAIDMALHDVRCLRENCSVGEMYAISHPKPIYSTYTIGISSEKELIAKLEEGKDFKIIKLKLGSEDDRALITAFRKHSKKPFCVDVNQGWKTRDRAASLAEFLEKSGAHFIEQPLPASHFEETNWVRQRVAIPIFADESVKRLPDLKYAADAFDGVNIKLMKSTGIAEAYKMIHKSRDLGLKVVLGAMAESSLGNTAAAHLAPLADWVDLDGPMLTSNNPFEGITYTDGSLVMPKSDGIGARIKPGISM